MSVVVDVDCPSALPETLNFHSITDDRGESIPSQRVERRVRSRYVIRVSMKFSEESRSQSSSYEMLPSDRLNGYPTTFPKELRIYPSSRVI